MKNYTIAHADIHDAAEILVLQKSAFLIEAARYNDYTITPLTQTLEALQNQFSDHVILKAIDENGLIIGTVRAIEKEKTCYIGRLAVHPDLHNQGIGAALMKEIEHCFNSKRYELFVGAKSENNLHLYKKLGYTVFKQNASECGTISLVYMEKSI